MQNATSVAVSRGANASFMGFLGSELDGCDGHPGQKGQKTLGDALVPLIKSHMGW